MELANSVPRRRLQKCRGNRRAVRNQMCGHALPVRFGAQWADEFEQTGWSKAGPQEGLPEDAGARSRASRQ
jgi:hypothetical protein